MTLNAIMRGEQYSIHNITHSTLSITLPLEIIGVFKLLLVIYHFGTSHFP